MWSVVSEPQWPPQQTLLSATLRCLDCRDPLSEEATPTGAAREAKAGAGNDSRLDCRQECRLEAVGLRAHRSQSVVSEQSVEPRRVEAAGGNLGGERWLYSSETRPGGQISPLTGSASGSPYTQKTGERRRRERSN